MKASFRKVPVPFAMTHHSLQGSVSCSRDGIRMRNENLPTPERISNPALHILMRQLFPGMGTTEQGLCLPAQKLCGVRILEYLPPNAWASQHWYCHGHNPSLTPHPPTMLDRAFALACRWTFSERPCNIGYVSWFLWLISREKSPGRTGRNHSFLLLLL